MFEEFENTLSAARTGDGPSLQRVVEWYWSNLHRFVSGRLRDRDQGEDILQDFLIDLVRRNVLSRFRGNSPVELRSFLLSSLRTFLKSRYRNSLTEQIAFEDIVLQERRWVSFAVSPSAEDTYLQAEELAAIGDAIMSLRFEYRRLVQLHLDGYTFAEIGSMLKIPPGTVSSSISRARDELRTYLSRRGIRP